MHVQRHVILKVQTNLTSETLRTSSGRKNRDMKTSSCEAHNRSLAGMCAGKIRNVASILSKSSWEVAFGSPSLDVDESWSTEFLVNRLITFLHHLPSEGVRITSSDERGEEVLDSWLLSSLPSLCIGIRQKAMFGTCTLLVGASV